MFMELACFLSMRLHLLRSCFYGCIGYTSHQLMDTSMTFEDSYCSPTESLAYTTVLHCKGEK